MTTSYTNSVVLPAKRDSMGETLSALRQIVAEMSERAGVEKQRMYNLKLAIDEIATNIIDYAYADRADGVIKVTSTVDDDTLTIALEDNGPPFDPRAHILQNSPDEPLETRFQEGGWGIHLAMTNVDRFHYERIGPYNRNYFIVKRS